MPFQPKPIDHGTGRGYKQEYYRWKQKGGPPPCADCCEGHRIEQRERMRIKYQTDPVWRANQIRKVIERERESRRRRRVGRIHDVLADHLETLERQWGTGVPMAVVIESVLDRHPNLNPESLRRVFYRLIDRGVAIRERVGDEVRYRLNAAEAGG